MTGAKKPFTSEYMELAVNLAKKARPSPNPRVGAVLVRDGAIVGKGFHEKPGLPHAEIIAIADAGEKANGADLYVTLEPCAHVGRTGPCVKAIEQAKIRRVFVGIGDPDLRVNGEGIRYLRNAGIEVVTDVDTSQCHRLLEGYITHRTTGHPHVTLKAAITLDGYIATTTYDSKWISSPASRRVTHRLRADSDAILVGIGTALKDDPLLTVRDAEGPSPIRIVLDSKLRLPLTSKLIKTAGETPVLIAHAENAPLKSKSLLQNIEGVSLLPIPTDEQGRLSLPYLLKELGEQRGILSLLVEGGGAVHSAFLEANLADHMVLFIAPKILGSGIPFSTFPQCRTIQEGLTVVPDEISRIDNDIYFRARVKATNSIKHQD